VHVHPDSNKENRTMSGKNRDYMAGLLSQLGASDRASARSLLEKAAQAHPEDPRPLTLLAAEYVHAGELDRAEATYIAALQRTPDLAIARFQLGLLQLTSARPATAQATWAPLDGLAETDPLRLFKTGLELLAQDRFDEARRFLTEGIALNRNNLPLNRDMQMVLDRMSQTPLGAAGPGGASRGGAASQTEGHILVSSYQKVP
jgi:tetratricopeptide (TPR) repeat protein